MIDPPEPEVAGGPATGRRYETIPDEPPSNQGSKRAWLAKVGKRLYLVRIAIAVVFVGLAMARVTGLFGFFGEPGAASRICDRPLSDSCTQPSAALRSAYSDPYACQSAGRKVCLVPIGNVPADLVDYLTAHYRATLGLDVQVLTPVALPKSALEVSRGQFRDDDLMDLLSGIYSSLCCVPDVVLLGLTAGDMYVASYTPWRFAFGTRTTAQARKVGVISIFRMRGDDDQYLRPRAAKMMTKYIGLMYYGLAESEDPKSVLYRHIISVYDLDHMGEVLRLPR